jgi:hypothetical protein
VTDRTLRLHFGRDPSRHVDGRVASMHFAGDELQVIKTSAGLVLLLAGGDVRHARLLTDDERGRLVAALLTTEERAKLAAEWSREASP